MDILRVRQNIIPKWLNSPIANYSTQSMDEIQMYIPEFDRIPGLVSGNDYNRESILNQRFHTIIRKPINNDKGFFPLGVVSKDYVLIQHSKVFEIVKQAIQDAGIDPVSVRTDLRITEYGERMHLSCFLPDKYCFDPGDGNKMALRLECFNSVDGTVGFRVLMGWYRFVCSNGLIIGITRFNLRRRHSGEIHLNDVGYALADGINESERDKDNLIRWRKSRIAPDRFKKWIEETIQKEWGYKAATRVYHISLTGSDVDIVGSYKGRTPFDIPTVVARRVPGCPSKVDNLFDLTQVLAWLAKERRDIQEQFNWREQIPELIEKLRV